MKARIIGNRRRDGKYKVAFSFEGGPNAFGGVDPGRTVNKILTPEALRESIGKHPGAYSPRIVARYGSA